MRTIWCTSALACSLVLIGASLVTGLNRAEARPKYKTQFQKLYPEVVKNHGKKGKLTCAVCHPKKDNKKKKKHNAYGQAIKKVIAKKEKDVEKIKAALLKVEKIESRTKGKSFGDLLKEGKLPDPE